MVVTTRPPGSDLNINGRLLYPAAFEANDGGELFEPEDPHVVREVAVRYAEPDGGPVGAAPLFISTARRRRDNGADDRVMDGAGQDQWAGVLLAGLVIWIAFALAANDRAIAGGGAQEMPAPPEKLAAPSTSGPPSSASRTPTKPGAPSGGMAAPVAASPGSAPTAPSKPGAASAPGAAVPSVPAPGTAVLPTQSAPAAEGPQALIIAFVKLETWVILGGLLTAIGYQTIVGRINTRYLFHGTRGDGSRYFSPERVQLLVMTLVVSGYYLMRVLSERSTGEFPVIPDTLVALLGGSHGIYLTRKLYSFVLSGAARTKGGP